MEYEESQPTARRHLNYPLTNLFSVIQPATTDESTHDSKGNAPPTPAHLQTWTLVGHSLMDHPFFGTFRSRPPAPIEISNHPGLGRVGRGLHRRWA